MIKMGPSSHPIFTRSTKIEVPPEDVLKTFGGLAEVWDGPFADETTAFGVNDSGEIVGRYTVGTRAHAFRWKFGGLLETFNFPNDHPSFQGQKADVTRTVALGINNNGIIVGHYEVNFDGGAREKGGFVYDETQADPADRWRKYLMPMASVAAQNSTSGSMVMNKDVLWTSIYAINDKFDLVGSYRMGETYIGGQGSAHGFVLREAPSGILENVMPKYLDVDANFTEAAGVNQLGDIVGVMGYPSPHGFLLPADQIDTDADLKDVVWPVQPFVPAAEAMSSGARGITNDLQIVGNYGSDPMPTPNSVGTGFIWTLNTWFPPWEATLVFEKALAKVSPPQLAKNRGTSLFGINKHLQVVGAVTDSNGKTHAFYLRPNPYIGLEVLGGFQFYPGWPFPPMTHTKFGVETQNALAGLSTYAMAAQLGSSDAQRALQRVGIQVAIKELRMLLDHLPK